MKKKKSNFLQKKNKKSRYVKLSNANQGVKYVEDKMKDNKEKIQIVEITPRLSSIDISSQNLSFDEKVEILAEDLKQEILQLHKEGNSVRYIGNKVGISRELARKVIKGEGSLKITAMQRIRIQEIQQMKF